MLERTLRMAFVFWISFGFVAYTYVGYALLLAAYACFRSRPIHQATITPSVSVLIAARNEAERLPAKISNLLALQYPAHLLQILIASDGSTDNTADILREHAPRVTPVILSEPSGKAAALNALALGATGEILVFFDVRQEVDLDAVQQLVACFADPRVGAVSGELLLQDVSGKTSGEALGIYWKIEKAIRKLESQTGSVVGATGAIYAIRRELFVEIPPGALLDDVLIPMNIARLAGRVVFQPAAIARDIIFAEQGKEFARKVRTLTGNYQMLELAPWLLSARNPLLFRFVSHKLLRLWVPLFLGLMLVSSAFEGGMFLRLMFGLQLVFYGFAGLGACWPAARKFKPIAVAYTFVLLNVAAVVAFRNFVTRRDTVWQ